MRDRSWLRMVAALTPVVLVAACGSSGGGGASGGRTGASGGAVGAGGASASGGAGTGGNAAASGGAPASGGAGGGGRAGSGGSGGAGTGGVASTGGRTGGGGAGTAGAGGNRTGGAGGAVACASGQIWCPGCTPGTGACYVGGCPGVACPPPDGGAPDAGAPTCAEVTTLAACDQRLDCHAVFVDPGTCGCATAGCCARFSRCADDDRANCKGPAQCRAATPFCEAPYVVAYTGVCFEGCVRATECAP